MTYSDFARTLTNVELADSLEYSAPHSPSERARAVMLEAAKRLRDTVKSRDIRQRQEELR